MMTHLRTEQFPPNPYATRISEPLPTLNARFGKYTVTGFFLSPANSISHVLLSCDCGGPDVKVKRACIKSLKQKMCIRCAKARTPVHEKVSYDAATGDFYWLDNSHYGRPRKGKKAGSRNPTLGYVVIGNKPFCVYAHRLAWEMTHGPIPDGMVIDHINRDGFDNRIANLRLASKRQNLMNSEMGDRLLGDHWPFLHPMYT
jgi:hypothetical protein